MTETPAGTGKPFAPWISRVGALIIDILPVLAVTLVFALLFGEKESGDGSFSIQLSGGPYVVSQLIGLAWFVYNWVIKQGNTGQTLGKKALNIAVFKTGTTEPLGPGLTFVRQLAHILDGIPCFIGYLFPLWDKEKRTFADMVMNSRVYQA